jgi:mannosyltransferase
MLDKRFLLFRKALPLGLILLLALSLRLYQLGHENFWIDEINQVKVASQSIIDIILNYHPQAEHGKFEQAPLSLLITHFFLSPGDMEWAARLPSAIFGTLGVLALFLFSRQLYPSSVALLAALFLAISPLHLWYSQEARWYAPWSLITTLSYVLLLHASMTRRATSWVSYGFLTLLNIYTFIFSFLVVVSQALTTWWFHRLHRGPRRLLLKFMLGHLLITGAAAPVLWLIINRSGAPTGTERVASVMALPYTFFAYTAGFSSGPSLRELHALPDVFSLVAAYPVILVFFAVFLPVFALGVHSVIREPLTSAFLLPWLFGLPLLVFLIDLFSNVTYQVRYTITSLPAFALILTLGALSLKRQIIRWGVIGLILLCSTASVANFYWDPRYDKEDVRAAMEHINGTALDGIQIISVGQIGFGMEHYGPNQNILAMNSCNVEGEENGSLPKTSFNSEVIWLIAGRDWSNQTEPCLDLFSKSYSIIDHQRFTGVKLWLLKQRREFNPAQ